MSIPETKNCEDACLKVKDKTYEDALERVKDEINRMGIKCYTSAVLNQLTSNFSASCIVGHGGYGVVYQGKFPNTGEQVAIKKLENKDIVEESETFMAEVRTMSNTNHRNLIKMKGYCFEPNTKALVYEFMENGSLDNILYKPDTSMKWEKLYHIAVEIAHGLMYLHEGSNEQIIHYDIKAGNVLLDNNHSPKIADFGLAKLIKRGVSGVPLSGKRGTNGYTAPELCTNRFSSIVTYKCDVYSFGMLLFEILGKRNINVREQGEYFPEQVWYSFDCGQLEHLLDSIHITKENRESAKILSKVALLCIQYHPVDRPTMKEVWLMLDKEKQVQRKPLIPFPLWKRSTISKSNHQITSGDFNGTSGSNERNSAAQDVPAQSQGDSHTKCFPEEITMTQPSFGDLLSGSEMDDPLGTGNSPSSFSEAGEDDPLPAIDGLQISGEAFPGQELQACGYSINGTTSCNFEWVRSFEDGSVNYIDGAYQPNYLVTADDVDTYLAIEVQPLDNRKRKGELVKVFANEKRKITCDSEMKEQIQKSLYSGQASYEVSLAARYIDIWEPAILAVKREGYSIKCIGPRGEVVTEKFLQKTAVTIPYGHPTAPTAFFILGSTEQLLKTENSSSRDTIVLTMRLFIMRAEEKRKAKKKGISFREMLSILLLRVLVTGGIALCRV